MTTASGTLASRVPSEDAKRSARLNVLTLNTDLPIFPGGGGVEYLTMTRLAALGGEVGIVSLVHSRQDLDRSAGLTAAGVHLYLWHSPWLDGVPPPGPHSFARRIHRRLTMLVNWLQSTPGHPLDTRLTSAVLANMAPGLLRALSERAWPVESIVQSSLASLIDRVPRPLVSVIVMHDVRARLYERRAAIATTASERRRLRREARRYFTFEREYCGRFDLVTTVSADDARWVREHYSPRRVVQVPLPVDTSHFAPQPEELECDGRIVFTGLLNHPPNIDAARYFATDVFPRIRERVPGTEFHIVGRNPDAQVLALAQLAGVRIFRDVPDIRTHLASAAVVVVPLRYGSGARQKILEAWSMEKCVVSTSIGAEGLEYENGENLAIADGSHALAQTVERALCDPEVRARLRRAGRTVAQRYHDPALVAAGYMEALEQVAIEKASIDEPMRVLLDMRWMIPGVAGGIENLARAFLQQLCMLDGRNEYAVIVPAQARYDLEGLPRPNVRIMALDSLPILARRIWERAARRAGAKLRLPYYRTPEVETLQWLRSTGAEIAYSFPGYIHPQVLSLRQVLVVPDIQHEYMPEFFSDQALAERQRVYTDSIRRADHICAISEFTRQTLIERLAVAPDKITTVPLAADAIFSPRPDGPEAAEAEQRILRAWGLVAGNYLFFPGHTWRHKNHRAAIEALRVLRDRFGRKPVLVCTGGAREAQASIDAQIATLGLEAQVRFLGYRSRRDLVALYRGATCLVFPSRFEGFGMPVLEAMASGCPVVCSNSTSLPEIAGDAAMLVDPCDPDAIAEAINGVLTNKDSGQELKARGLRRARAFSWRRHTLETIAVLRRVHDQMRGRPS
jgi:glycosyltransferase involved in cell wall biosynthesis